MLDRPPSNNRCSTRQVLDLRAGSSQINCVWVLDRAVGQHLLRRRVVDGALAALDQVAKNDEQQTSVFVLELYVAFPPTYNPPVLSAVDGHRAEGLEA